MNNTENKDELTALVRLYATHRSPERAQRIAEVLLERFGTLERVLLASFAELTATSGVKETDAAFLKLYLAIDSRRRTERLRFGEIPTEQQIREYLIGLFVGKAEETIYLMTFDAAGRVISCDCVAAGTINSASVTARRLLDFAVSYRAHSVILAHNHPGGTTAASNEDLRLTGNYAALFASAGIRLREHYIVAAEACYGIMQQMASELHSPYESSENS